MITLSTDQLPTAVEPGPAVMPDGSVRLWIRAATFGRVDYPELGAVAWVDPEVSFPQSYLDSMVGNPIYLGEHPPEPTPPGYAARHSVGSILAVQVLAGEVYVQIEVRTAEGLAYGEERGWRICCSLSYDLTQGPGRYGCDFTQLRTINHHIALVDNPRHGPRTRAINTSYDSLGGVSMPEALKALLSEYGVPSDKIEEAIAKIVIAMEASDKADMDPAAADPKKVMPDADKAAADAMRRALADTTAQLKAARAELDAERLLSCRAAVLGAADSRGLKPGDKPDLIKIAEEVCALNGVPRRGLDAALFLRDLASTQARDSKPALKPRLDINPITGADSKIRSYEV